MTSKNNILVIKLGALGDFVQALGPMRAIRNHHPGNHITLLTTAPFINIAEQSGYFDDVHTDTRPRWHNFKDWQALKSFFNRGNFSRVYDLQNNDRTALYFRLFQTPKPEWVGTAKGASHRNTNPDRTKGQAYDGHVGTLALAGIHDIAIDKMEWMKADIKSFRITKPYALLIPGSSPQHLRKRWSADKYAAVANMLAEKKVSPVLIGSDAEKDIAEKIMKGCPACIDLTGKTDFFQITALARNAALALGNDTGPMHLIGPTGCHTFILFSGHSDPVRHAPKGKNIHIIRKEDLKTLDIKSVQNALEKIPLCN